MNTKVHYLKIRKIFYEHLCDGSKRFEIRKNDRNFQIGDKISFRVVNEDGSITEKNDLWAIIYILESDQFPDGIKDGYVVMSIEMIRGCA